MQRIVSAFILIFFSGVLNAHAQMNGPAPQSLSGTSAAGEPVPNTPEWQLTLDVIKSKAKVLMEREAQLMNEHETLQAAYQKAGLDNRDWQLKNEALRQLLKERHGRSDQQMQIEELNQQIKAKESNINSLKDTLADIQKETSLTERRLGLRKLKASEIELHVKLEASQARSIDILNQRSALEKDGDFKALKEKLRLEKEQEADLQDQLDALKKASMAQVVPGSADETQIKDLEEKAESLRKQKEDLQNRVNGDNNQTKAQQYLQLTAKKKELEDKIKEFEAQLNRLKEPSTFGLLDPRQKKQIIRQMSQIDSRNIQLRQKLADLRQDVTLLREQVSRLERKTGVRDSEDDKK